MKTHTLFLGCFLPLFSWLAAVPAGAAVEPVAPTVKLATLREAHEAELIVAAALKIPRERRIAFVSGYFLGRVYPQSTKKRIKQERTKPVTKAEATNPLPLPIERLTTSLTQLDCMTYVEHVLALASCHEPRYSCFLDRLIDVMFDAGGGPLLNHLRCHFTSHWADTNERKGYLVNVARGHPLAKQRAVWLNKVGNNRTFFTEDRFLIATAPQIVDFFPRDVVLQKRAPLANGDVIALACDKEGLDVTHMAFVIVRNGETLMRHASYTKERIIEEDLFAYINEKKTVTGLMVLRPVLQAPVPPAYRYVVATPKAKAKPRGRGKRRTSGKRK